MQHRLKECVRHLSVEWSVPLHRLTPCEISPHVRRASVAESTSSTTSTAIPSDLEEWQVLEDYSIDNEQNNPIDPAFDVIEKEEMDYKDNFCHRQSSEAFYSESNNFPKYNKEDEEQNNNQLVPSTISDVVYFCKKSELCVKSTVFSQSKGVTCPATIKSTTSEGQLPEHTNSSFQEFTDVQHNVQMAFDSSHIAPSFISNLEPPDLHSLETKPPDIRVEQIISTNSTKEVESTLNKTDLPLTSTELHTIKNNVVCLSMNNEKLTVVENQNQLNISTLKECKPELSHLTSIRNGIEVLKKFTDEEKVLANTWWVKYNQWFLEEKVSNQYFYQQNTEFVDDGGVCDCFRCKSVSPGYRWKPESLLETYKGTVQEVESLSNGQDCLENICPKLSYLATHKTTSILDETRSQQHGNVTQSHAPTPSSNPLSSTLISVSPPPLPLFPPFRPPTPPPLPILSTDVPSPPSLLPFQSTQLTPLNSSRLIEDVSEEDSTYKNYNKLKMKLPIPNNMDYKLVKITGIEQMKPKNYASRILIYYKHDNNSDKTDLEPIMDKEAANDQSMNFGHDKAIGDKSTYSKQHNEKSNLDDGVSHHNNELPTLMEGTFQQTISTHPEKSSSIENEPCMIFNRHLKNNKTQEGIKLIESITDKEHSCNHLQNIFHEDGLDSLSFSSDAGLQIVEDEDTSDKTDLEPIMDKDAVNDKSMNYGHDKSIDHNSAVVGGVSHKINELPALMKGTLQQTISSEKNSGIENESCMINKPNLKKNKGKERIKLIESIMDKDNSCNPIENLFHEDGLDRISFSSDAGLQIVEDKESEVDTAPDICNFDNNQCLAKTPLTPRNVVCLLPRDSSNKNSPLKETEIQVEASKISDLIQVTSVIKETKTDNQTPSDESGSELSNLDSLKENKTKNKIIHKYIDNTIAEDPIECEFIQDDDNILVSYTHLNKLVSEENDNNPTSTDTTEETALNKNELSKSESFLIDDLKLTSSEEDSDDDMYVRPRIVNGFGDPFIIPQETIQTPMQKLNNHSRIHTVLPSKDRKTLSFYKKGELYIKTETAQNKHKSLISENTNGKISDKTKAPVSKSTTKQFYSQQKKHSKSKKENANENNVTKMKSRPHGLTMLEKYTAKITKKKGTVLKRLEQIETYRPSNVRKRLTKEMDVFYSINNKKNNDTSSSKELSYNSRLLQQKSTTSVVQHSLNKPKEINITHESILATTRDILIKNPKPITENTDNTFLVQSRIEGVQSNHKSQKIKKKTKNKSLQVNKRKKTAQDILFCENDYSFANNDNKASDKPNRKELVGRNLKQGQKVKRKRNPKHSSSDLKNALEIMNTLNSNTADLNSRLPSMPVLFLGKDDSSNKTIQTESSYETVKNDKTKRFQKNEKVEPSLMKIPSLKVSVNLELIQDSVLKTLLSNKTECPSSSNMLENKKTVTTQIVDETSINCEPLKRQRKKNFDTKRESKRTKKFELSKSLPISPIECNNTELETSTLENVQSVTKRVRNYGLTIEESVTKKQRLEEADVSNCFVINSSQVTISLVKSIQDDKDIIMSCNSHLSSEETDNNRNVPVENINLEESSINQQNIHETTNGKAPYDTKGMEGEIIELSTNFCIEDNTYSLLHSNNLSHKQTVKKHSTKSLEEIKTKKQKKCLSNKRISSPVLCMIELDRLANIDLNFRHDIYGKNGCVARRSSSEENACSSDAVINRQQGNILHPDNTHLSLDVSSNRKEMVYNEGSNNNQLTTDKQINCDTDENNPAIQTSEPILNSLYENNAVKQEMFTGNVIEEMNNELCLQESTNNPSINEHPSNENCFTTNNKSQKEITKKRDTIRVKDTSLLTEIPEVSNLSQDIHVRSTSVDTGPTSARPDPAKRISWYMAPDHSNTTQSNIPTINQQSQMSNKMANACDYPIDFKDEDNIIERIGGNLNVALTLLVELKSLLNKGMTHFGRLSDVIDCLQFDVSLKKEVINNVKKLSSKTLIDDELKRAKKEYENQLLIRERDFRKSFVQLLQNLPDTLFAYPIFVAVCDVLVEKVKHVTKGDTEELRIISGLVMKWIDNDVTSKLLQPHYDFKQDCEVIRTLFKVGETQVLLFADRPADVIKTVDEVINSMTSGHKQRHKTVENNTPITTPKQSNINNLETSPPNIVNNSNSILIDRSSQMSDLSSDVISLKGVGFDNPSNNNSNERSQQGDLGHIQETSGPRNNPINSYTKIIFPKDVLCNTEASQQQGRDELSYNPVQPDISTLKSMYQHVNTSDLNTSKPNRMPISGNVSSQSVNLQSTTTVNVPVTTSHSTNSVTKSTTSLSTHSPADLSSNSSNMQPITSEPGCTPVNVSSNYSNVQSITSSLAHPSVNVSRNLSSMQSTKLVPAYNPVNISSNSPNMQSTPTVPAYSPVNISNTSSIMQSTSVPAYSPVNESSNSSIMQSTASVPAYSPVNVHNTPSAAQSIVSHAPVYNPVYSSNNISNMHYPIKPVYNTVSVYCNSLPMNNAAMSSNFINQQHMYESQPLGQSRDFQLRSQQNIHYTIPNAQPYLAPSNQPIIHPQAYSFNPQTSVAYSQAQVQSSISESNRNFTRNQVATQSSVNKNNIPSESRPIYRRVHSLPNTQEMLIHPGYQINNPNIQTNNYSANLRRHSTNDVQNVKSHCTRPGENMSFNYFKQAQNNAPNIYWSNQNIQLQKNPSQNPVTQVQPIRRLSNQNVSPTYLASSADNHIVQYFKPNISLIPGSSNFNQVHGHLQTSPINNHMNNMTVQNNGAHTQFDRNSLDELHGLVDKLTPSERQRIQNSLTSDKTNLMHRGNKNQENINSWENNVSLQRGTLSSSDASGQEVGKKRNISSGTNNYLIANLGQSGVPSIIDNENEICHISHGCSSSVKKDTLQRIERMFVKLSFQNELSNIIMNTVSLTSDELLDFLVEFRKQIDVCGLLDGLETTFSGRFVASDGRTFSDDEIRLLSRGVLLLGESNSIPVETAHTITFSDKGFHEITSSNKDLENLITQGIEHSMQAAAVLQQRADMGNEDARLILDKFLKTALKKRALTK